MLGLHTLLALRLIVSRAMCVLPRAIGLLFQLHEDLEAVPIKEWCGELCGPTFLLGPGQVFTQVS